MKNIYSLLYVMFFAALMTGCATLGPTGGSIPKAQIDRAKVIAIALPHELRTVKKELWQQAMVDLGLEETMIEHLSENTEATIMTGRLADAALNPARAEAAGQIRDFSEAVRQTPNAVRNLESVISTQLATHPMAQMPDYVLAAWISRFDVTGTTKSFAGPLSGQSRDCRVRAEVALYDVNRNTIIRNSGDGEWSVQAMSLVVSPTNLITDFDLSAAGRASQEALNKAIDNLIADSMTNVDM